MHSCSVLIGLAMLAALAPRQALAAEITSEMFKGAEQTRLVLRLEGPIQKGDAARIEAILDAANLISFADYTDQVIAFDSPGGSYTEGLAIADVLRSRYVGSYVDDGARCESACAIAFMGGTDANGNESWRDRRLHPRGTLGIHAPSLVVPQSGTVPVGQIASAYDAALLSVARLVDNMRVMDIQPSFISAMLATPANTMRHIRTVDDANRWQIEIDTSLELPRIDERVMLNLCLGVPLWSQGMSMLDEEERMQVDFDDMLVSEFRSFEVKRDGTVFRYHGYISNEMDGTYCYLREGIIFGQHLAHLMSGITNPEDVAFLFESESGATSHVVPTHGLAPNTPIDTLPAPARSRLALPQ